MCAQRLLRSGLSDEPLKGPAEHRHDPRQVAFDLDPSSSSAEQLIYRLAYENEQLRARLRNAGLPADTDGAPEPRHEAMLGGNGRPDPVAEIAKRFAAEVAQLTSTPLKELDANDAEQVNASVELIAEEADALITAVIDDAETSGLEATGPWMKVPLVEQRAFEVPEYDVEAAKADAARDQKLNS